MKYSVHTDDYSKINGTCYQGQISCSYDELVKAFGKPGKGDEYKTDAEWIVEFEDGTVAAVYNWKDGKSYCGPDGYEVEDIPQWNIGGHNKQAPALVRFVILGE